MKNSGNKKDYGQIRVHMIGASVCVLIAAGSVWFAADSVAKRRGLFLSARHELKTAKDKLNDTLARRTALTTRVQNLERLTSQQLELVSVKRVNARTAEIVRLAETTGLSVDSLQPLDMITDARVPVQPLELIGVAQADSVSDLLAKLGELMPDMHIQTIELASQSLGSDRVRVRLLMYWFVDPSDTL